MQAPDSWERLKSLPKVMLSVSQLHFQKSHGLYHVIYVFYEGYDQELFGAMVQSEIESPFYS